METKIVVAQLGARQDYTVPLAFQKAGILERLFTDAYVSPTEARLLKPLLGVHSIGKVLKRGLSRHNSSLDYGRVTRFNLLGIKYLESLKAASGSIEKQYRAFVDYGRSLNGHILRRGLPDSTHLYAFDHAALDLFGSPAARGRKLVLDQIYPALYEERIEEEEEELWPGWARAPRTPFYRSELFGRWREMQIEEWRLADTIIVASEYSRRAIASLSLGIEHKLKIVPLTVNLDVYTPHRRIRRCKVGRPLNVLFAGGVNLRKGLPYLLKAFDVIPPSDARLTVAGEIQISSEKIKEFGDRVRFLGPVPHVQMPQAYRDADLFVFPTSSDGFGAVMLEAMATGLPVISTGHSGDIVEDCINGFRIPIRDSEAIVEKICEVARRPELLMHLSDGAAATSNRFSLASYQARLCSALDIPLNK